MSGVDYNGQLLACFPLAQRTVKWTTKVFMHSLTLSVIQSSIIFNKLQVLTQQKPLPLPHYVKLLEKQLSEEFSTTASADRQAPAMCPNKPKTLLWLDHLKFHYLVSLPATKARLSQGELAKYTMKKKPRYFWQKKEDKRNFLLVYSVWNSSLCGTLLSHIPYTSKLHQRPMISLILWGFIFLWTLKKWIWMRL